MPHLLFQIALVIIAVRSAYMALKTLEASGINWIELLYHASVTYVAVWFLL